MNSFYFIRSGFIILCLWFCTISGASGQSLPKIFWENALGGGKNDEITFLEQTSDGGYLAGGFSESGQSEDKASAGYGLTDFWVIKLNFDGQLQWEKTYGGTDQDICYLMLQTSDGGFLLGGSSKSGRNEHKSQSNVGSFDYWVIRLDSNGNKLWDRTFGGLDYDFLYALQQTPDGNFILGGYSESGVNGDKTATIGLPDYWVVKIDGNGNKLWDKTLGEADADAIYVMRTTPDGGFILGGGSSRNMEKLRRRRRSSDEYHVQRFSENGTLLWTKSYGGMQNDYLTALQVTRDGGCIIGGVSTSGKNGDKSQPNQGKGDFWLVRLDAKGEKKWDKTYGGKGYDYLATLQLTLDGGYILGGHTSSPKGGDKTHNNKGKTDFWLIKTDARGNKLWDETYGGTEDDALYALQQTSDGGYILGGVSDSPVSGHKNTKPKGLKDIWLLKLNVLEPTWNSR